VTGDEVASQAGVTGAARRAEASLLGVRFDLYTRAELRAWIRELLAAPARNVHIAFSNSEFLLEARRNPRLRDYLNHCDWNFVDSTGVMAGLGFVNRIPRPVRLSGTVFVAMLCEEAAKTGDSIFLFGSKPGVAERAGERLARRAPGLRVAGTADGFGDAATVMDRIRETKPDIVSVCIGGPAQEFWVEDHLAELDLKLVWGAGGALDFYSGDVPLAPDWIQRAGLEWLFRLVTNFSFARLRRQLRLVHFVGLVVAERLRRGRRRRATR
jgi:N-acetylglucosaminyldiphosphoundecaprenol N-acetyl-beta-D-mannosaminyltransferase